MSRRRNKAEKRLRSASTVYAWLHDACSGYKRVWRKWSKDAANTARRRQGKAIIEEESDR